MNMAHLQLLKMQNISQEQLLLQQITTTFTKQQLLDLLYSQDQILSYLQKRDLQNFLLNIDSTDLREACMRKQNMGDQTARSNRNYMKKNVLNLTIDELVKLAWFNRLITFDQYNNHFAPRYNSFSFKHKKFLLKDHCKLGFELIEHAPEKYEVGQRSEHYNRSRQIQIMYGLRQPDQYYSNQSEIDSKKNEDEGSDFIDDREQVSLVYSNNNQNKENNNEQQQDQEGQKYGIKNLQRTQGKKQRKNAKRRLKKASIQQEEEQNFEQPYILEQFDIGEKHQKEEAKQNKNLMIRRSSKITEYFIPIVPRQAQQNYKIKRSRKNDIDSDEEK